MVLVPRGTSLIGNDHFYPEERPAREESVGDVWGDELSPGGAVLANTWRGPFPRCSDDPHGFDRTSTCCGSLRLQEADRMVTKGGSHLCSPDYCQRYRPAARQGHGVRDTTSHLGFRCVRRP